MTSSETPQTPFTPDAAVPLRRTPYATWLVCDTGSQLSGSLASFAVPLLALATTNSATLAGVIGAVGLAVRVLATPLGGLVADRRRHAGLLLTGAAVGLALAATLTVLSAAARLDVVVLLALEVGFGLRGGLFGPASDAALKDVVPDTRQGSAQAMNQSRDAALSLGAAPLGGALLAVGPWLVGAVMVLGHLAAGAAAARLRRVALPATTEHDDGAGTGRAVGTEANGTAGGKARAKAGATVGAEAGLAAAWRWMWAQPALRGVLTIITTLNLGYLVVTSGTVYALKQAGSTPFTIGLVTAGTGVGMILGALVAGPAVRRVPTGVLTIAALSLLSAGVVLVAAVPAPRVVALGLAIATFGVPSVNAALLGYTTVMTPRRLIGRVSALLQTASLLAMPLGPLIAGAGLDLLGRTPMLLVGAVLCIAAALGAAANRALRRLPVERGWRDTVAGTQPGR